ncbi:MAG TPA: RecX family transcriptional regulator [Stellaceae bacterium]|nr:RecX family transcriptional regulator [Stellaceae bacterium]
MAEPSKTAKTPKPATPERLEKAGLAYLARFASSSANLRTVLMRKVKRSAMIHGTDAEAGAKAVEALVQRWVRAGMVDDRLFAEGKTASLHRRGLPARRIAEKLAEKGIDRDLASQVIDAHAEESGGDLAAAAKLAKRRRLGPYRHGDRDRQKELATFARAGFERRIAEMVIRAASIQDLEEMLAAERDG